MSKQSDAIRVWMAQNNLKNKDLVEATGILKETMSNYVTGTRAWSKNAAARMSEVYGMDAVFLITGNGSLFPATGNTAPVFNAGRDNRDIHISDSAKDRIIAQLTASNEKMADTISRLSQTVESLTAKL